MNNFQKWASKQTFSSVPSDLNFVAMDMSGDIHVFARRPRTGTQFWMQGGDSVFLRGVKGGADGDCLDWKDCLYEIPTRAHRCTRCNQTSPGGYFMIGDEQLCGNCAYSAA